MRLFFGLAPEQSLARAITDWRDSQLPCDGKPVTMANLHITLAFLGNLDNRALERLCDSVDDWHDGDSTCATPIQLNVTGYWPKPGIFWLGPDQWSDTLNASAKKLRSLGASVGAKKDRNPFRPHVTLYRHCNRPPMQPTTPPDFELSYTELHLLESKQGRRGVSYTSIARWPL